MRRLISVLLLTLTLAPGAFAHPGGLDSNGGHTNHKTGEYHCHRDPCSSGASTSQPASSPLTSASSFSSSSGFSPAPETASQSFVMRVIDGDTLELSTGEKVRLIGVDTPETVHPTKPVQHFGKEASAFTKRLVEGKTVRLEYDQQHTDKYDRTLAYVYLMDGRMVNAEIIKQGYGFAYVKYPFQRMDEFRGYEREAREARRGLWAEP